jgi:hypothetical protein
MMGAGFASSTVYNVNPNLMTAGGSKKQGLTSRVGLNPWSDRSVQINANGTPIGRNMIFVVNQLGGIGVGKSMFNVPGSYAKKRGARGQSYPYPSR